MTAASSTVNLAQPDCALVATQPSASPAFRMLVVDVNEGPRASIQMIMRSVFPLVHVDFAPDPWSALRWLAKQEYDLVLAETRLPGLSGHELVRQIRAKHPRGLVRDYDGVGAVHDSRSA
ncbi:MAG: response regulator [Verrucomicrobiota bacterium]